MEAHDFLNQNRTDLNLPKPNRFTFSYEIY